MEESRNISHKVTCNKDTNKKLVEKIMDNLDNYLKERSLSDSLWIKAISSQYFLIEIAYIMNLTETNSYQELEEEFLNTSCVFRKGVVQPSPQKILVVPDENEKLIDRMKQEDDAGADYPNRLRASRINTKAKKDRIFYNYYYGLMAGIINILCTSNVYLENYEKIRMAVIAEIFNPDAIDEAGGWIHFRLPWMTARILISLSSYSDETIQQLISGKAFSKTKINSIESYHDFINQASRSLVTRLHGKSIWGSGAGDWVTCWESTGLCLEALFSLGVINDYIKDVKKIINFLFLEENIREWLVTPSFIDEISSNRTLSSVILSSVVYRLMSNGVIETDENIKNLIEGLFLTISTEILRINNERVQQYCTIPQIIYYIIKALL